MALILSGDTGPSFVQSAALPNGSVLQVVNSKTTSGIINSSNSSYADSGLTATITPKYSTSKIVILIAQNGVNSSSANTGVILRLLRDGTQISPFGQYIGYGLIQFVSGNPLSYVDSPASTSAVTYKTQFKLGTGSGIAYVQDNGCESTMTLMEIAA
jgi:hypothetical protein